MKIIDRIAKRLGYRRIQKRNSGGWDAAAISRLMQKFGMGELAADSQIRRDLKKLRERSRDLRDNNDYANKFLTMLKTNVLGETGIGMRNKAKDPDRIVGGRVMPGVLDIFANQRIDNAWFEWGKKENCTVTKKLTWADVQNIVLETCGTDGEHLIRIVRGFDNKFKFALQLIESDMLDIEFNKDLGNGRQIRMGVEINQWDEPIAYHLLRSNPNETYFGWTVNNTLYNRIPADEIIHPYIHRRAGQTRGTPWMSTAMTRLNMIGKYEEAEQVAARASADKMGFFKATGDVQYDGDDDGLGNRIMNAEAGSFEILPRGLELQSWDPQHPNTAFGTFIKTCLRGIAAGLGAVSYNTLANDMESVNFASGKLGLDEERRGWRMIRRWFIDNFHTEVYEYWLEFLLMTGQLAPLPMSKFDKFNSPVWRGASWGFVDPTKETTAKLMQLAAGLTSPQKILAEQDEDWQDTLGDLSEFATLAKSLGLNIQFGTTPIQPEPEPAANTAT